MLLKTYTISTDLSNGYIEDQLNEEIASSSAITNYSHFIINGEEDKIYLYGDSISNQTALDSLISNHVPNMTVIVVKNTVIENKQFADDLMQRLKEKNILDGLNSIDQSAWVHHRLRKIDYTLSDNTTVVQLDLMNLVVSGDIETAEQALGQVTPDDMTEAYHWLDQARIDWIRNEIRTFLGWPLL